MTCLHNDCSINETRVQNFSEDKVLRDYMAEDETFNQYDMYNTDLYTKPYRKYYYNVRFKNVRANFYIVNGIVSGVFENVFVSCNDGNNYSFWDCAVFKKCKFINCHFEKLGIRWCKFDNCQFITCTGTIRYIRASTFKKNCVFENSDIQINQVDEYFFVNNKRQPSGYCPVQLCERFKTTE